MSLLKKIIQGLMPTVCLFCNTLTDRPQAICIRCRNDLPLLKHHCQICANRLPADTFARSCGQCLRQKPPFDTTHGLFFYEPPIPKFILDLKFHHALTHARLLGELLLEKILQEWYQKTPLPTVIIPMPLHPDRLKERGFNQAIEIARPIARALHVPLSLHDAVRIKSTKPQATLPASKRKQNIRNAFLIKKSFENQHVAVLDDVITTGNTLHEFCRQLKKHGAARISVFCAARCENKSASR
ncbi:MAG TPA: ComF family protein [Gammaproteobacteria bacterium]|nr:ComF family protein [Gammaproteobacteria bacterium]